MDWVAVFVLALAIAGACMLVIRTVSGRRWASLLICALIGLLVFRWANYRGAWAEVSLAAAGGLLGFFTWWLLKGRLLPEPKDKIRVWSEDDPF